MPITREALIKSQSPTLELTCALIRRQSVSPVDAGCQDMLIERLEALDFDIHRLPFEDVENFWAIRGSDGPILCFAGHTDVVPVGEIKDWHSEPFEPVLKDNLLYGRGAADMKGSLAAMITATETFVKNHPSHDGRIAFLITSDEEGPAINGTTRVVDWLSNQGIAPEWCIVGEPSSSRVLGDTVKIGRRGSLNARLTVKGIQGHIAYPQLADNPIHKLIPALSIMTTKTWDEGNEQFPPTSFQISNINAGTGTTNVIPGEIIVDFNFRFSTEITSLQLQSLVEDILSHAELNYHINWQLSGEPFLTTSATLTDAVVDCIQKNVGEKPELSTGGGTSDGRFIATLGTQIVEFGPVNNSIHKIDEHILVADLDRLTNIYRDILTTLLVP
ncbi:MAG: succinyl-diaminopimelate desuccinylase [Gammaproteobacteria bacterium]|nr:MAG: succinyl-diaminopimelate desuccinylase [Gammaproteobacteria bacterium]RLA54665.1 MAG: succinyl-diaminopimelate desuccinylase [Gammaproteobacteria bacterium]